LFAPQLIVPCAVRSALYLRSRLTVSKLDAHAREMGWTRLLEHGKVRRTAAVDAYEFPGSVRQRFATHHEELTADDIRTVEAAARQWFRLAARHPRTRLSMPSLVVDDLWHEMVLHTVDYAAFCEAALGRFLHHVPESATASPAAAANRSSALLATFHLARQDEGGGPDQLPLLFRVDHQLAVDGGRHYLARALASAALAVAAAAEP
jgi:hypothetical protein